MIKMGLDHVSNMNSWLIIGVLALYIVVLFGCAFFGEKHASRLSPRGRMLLFSLTLGVYCSSWTFYGATGAAVREGVIFLPIYLGPILLMLIVEGLKGLSPTLLTQPTPRRGRAAPAPPRPAMPRPAPRGAPSRAGPHSGRRAAWPPRHPAQRPRTG